MIALWPSAMRIPASSIRRKNSTTSSPRRMLAKPEIHGGFALAHWNGTRAVEEQVKNDLKVTIRCIPFDDPGESARAGTVV